MSDETTQTDRITEEWEKIRDSEDYDYQRVVYEIPHGMGWADTEGYVVGTRAVGTGYLKIFREGETENIPMDRVIRTHTKEPDHDE